MNIFEKIWVDFILNIKDPDYKSMWKFYTMFIMTILLSLNVMTLMMFLVPLGISVPNFNIDIFYGRMLDGFIESFLICGIPSVLINYFTVFYKERYKKLIKRYKGHNAIYILLYFVITIVLFLIPIVIL